jgi:hypothetical protein
VARLARASGPIPPRSPPHLSPVELPAEAGQHVGGSVKTTCPAQGASRHSLCSNRANRDESRERRGPAPATRQSVTEDRPHPRPYAESPDLSWALDPNDPWGHAAPARPIYSAWRGALMDGQPMQRPRRWMPLTLLLVLFIAAQVAVGIAGAIAPKPRGHWTGHLTNATIDAAMLTVVVAGAALAWRRLGQRLALLVAVVALAVVTVGLVVEVVGNLRVAHSIWRTPYGDEQVDRIGSQFNGYDSGHDLQSKGDLVVLGGGVAFAVILGATKRVGEWAMIAGIILSIIPPPFIIPACGVVFLLAWLLRPSSKHSKPERARPLREAT